MGKPDDPRGGYIAIAARLFARDGYHGTSLAALATEAGVTKQALLHFFGTKERLYAAVLTDLATRQCAEVDAAARPDPAEHLLTYFTAFRAAALSRPDDTRLVIRALLDSHEAARIWPMKPYLDKLVALVRQIPNGRDISHDEALTRVFQVIGAIQYLAIALPAISGMYGKGTAKAVQENSERIFAGAMQGIVSPKPDLPRS